MKRIWSKITWESDSYFGSPVRINCYEDGHLSLNEYYKEPYKKIDNLNLSKSGLRELDQLVSKILTATPKSDTGVMDGQFVEIRVFLKNGSIGGIHFYHEPIDPEINAIQERICQLLNVRNSM